VLLFMLYAILLQFLSLFFSSVCVAQLLESSNIRKLLTSSSSSRMRVIYHNWSATKQRPHPQSVAEISRHSVLSGDRI